MISKQAEKLKSFLGTESEFQGDLTVRGTLRMDGTITGRVQADQVILSATAVMNGEISARKIIVGDL